MEKYKSFNHTADIGYEIFGRTRKALFVNAAAALMDLIIHRPPTAEIQSSTIRKVRINEKTLTLEGTDQEDLLINFLREILFLFNGKKLIVVNCRIIELSPRRLVAKLQVEPYNIKQHCVRTEIKAVTYHDFSIRKVRQGWRARVIFDV